VAIVDAMEPGTRLPEAGAQIGDWRRRRRLSQLELALDAGVSTRHLSFVETGRSRPGRDLVLRLLECLEVPYRERNRVLLLAGHAPAFPERSLDHPELQPVRQALEMILTRHDPYPAVVIDRSWNFVTANQAMWRLTGSTEVDPSLLVEPINILRLGLHPRGLAPMMVNLAEWRSHFRERVARQVALTGDVELAALCKEIDGYPATGEDAETRHGEVLGPLKIRDGDGQVLSFLGMFATFDTPFELLTSELGIELLFPADEPTAESLNAGGVPG